MRRTKGHAASICLLALVLAGFRSAEAAVNPGADQNRFSAEPDPLRTEDFPARPRPLLELGDHFLGPGNLQRGFTLPSGAVWSPNLWVFGTLRSAVQTFDQVERTAVSRTTEWANRLDLYANLQLTATERFLVGWRPVDENGTRYTGYQFEPLDSPHNGHRGFIEAYDGTPRTFFFEGELGEIFPRLDQADRRNWDYGFAVGRQPLTLQDGILVNDDSVDMISVTRNSLNIPGGSTLRLSSYFAWDKIERHDPVRGRNVQDSDAQMVGLNAAADFSLSTVDADILYVNSSNNGEGFYAGIGSNQRLGKINTVFRINTSVAIERESAKVRNGTLLFGEVSFTPSYGDDLVYLNGFWGIDEFSSADRSPTAGGPLGRVGILNAAVGLGRYPAPLSDQSAYAAGGNIGYQMFFGELRRRQVILEIGGRAPTRSPASLLQQPSAGVGVRYQQAIGQRVVLILDTFGVTRVHGGESYGGRCEFLVKF